MESKDNNDMLDFSKTYSSTSVETNTGRELRAVKPLMNLTRLAAGIDDAANKSEISSNQYNQNKKNAKTTKEKKQKFDVPKTTVEQNKEERNRNSLANSKTVKNGIKMKNKSKSKERLPSAEKRERGLSSDRRKSKDVPSEETGENNKRRIELLEKRILELREELNTVKRDLVTEDDNQRFDWLQSQLNDFEQMISELRDTCQRNKLLSEMPNNLLFGATNHDTEYHPNHDDNVYEAPRDSPKGIYHPEKTAMHQQSGNDKQTALPSPLYNNNHRTEDRHHPLQPSNNFYSLIDTVANKDSMVYRKSYIAGTACQTFDWDAKPIPELDGKNPYKLEPSRYSNIGFAADKTQSPWQARHKARGDNYVSAEKLLLAAENRVQNGKTPFDLPETSNRRNRSSSRHRNKNGDPEPYSNTTSDWHCNNNDGNIIVLRENLAEAVDNLTKDHKASHIALTLLIRPDNIYHISVSLLRTGEVLGCLFANEKCITEASKQGLFETYLSFFVVDSHNSIEQKKRLLQYSFHSSNN